MGLDSWGVGGGDLFAIFWEGGVRVIEHGLRLLELVYT